MSTRLKQAVRASLEDVITTDPTQVEDQPQVNVDEAVSDTEFARRYAEQAAADAETVVDVTEALEAIALSLEAATKTGGLTPRDASYANMAIEQQLNRIGFESETLSLENFGGTKTRTEATQLTLESVSDKLKQLWEAIKAMVGRVWLAVKKFFANLVNSCARLRSYAETILKQAQALPSGSTAPKYTTLSPKLAAQLAIGVRTDWRMTHNFPELTNKLHQMTENVTDNLQQLNADLLEVMVKGEHSRLKGIEESLGRMFNQGDYVNAGRVTEEGNIRIRRSDLMPGNKRLVLSMYIPEEDLEKSASQGAQLAVVARAVGKFSAELVTETPRGDVVEAMDTLSIADIRLLATSVIKVCDWSKSFDQRIEVLSKQTLDALEAAGKKMIYISGGPLSENHLYIAKSKDHEVGNDGMQSSDVYRAFSQSAKNVAMPAIVFQSYAISLSRAVANAAHRCLLEYQGKGGAQKDAAAQPAAPVDAAAKAA